MLLARYQRPKAIRQSGITRLTRILADAGVRNAHTIAQAAVSAAKSQTVRLPGEQVAAGLVAELAQGVISLDERIKQTDADIEERFRRHPLAPQRYSRRLRRVMFMSALTAIRCDPHSQAYYQRKREQGKRPIPATICLARRRTDVLYALIRDNRTWQPEPPAITTTAA